MSPSVDDLRRYNLNISLEYAVNYHGEDKAHIESIEEEKEEAIPEDESFS